MTEAETLTRRIVTVLGLAVLYADRAPQDVPVVLDHAEDLILRLFWLPESIDGVALRRAANATGRPSRHMRIAIRERDRESLDEAIRDLEAANAALAALLPAAVAPRSRNPEPKRAAA